MLKRKTSAKAKSSKQKSDKQIWKITFVVMGVFMLVVGVAVYGKLQAKLCANSISCIDDLSGKKETATEGVFMGKKVIARDTPNTPAFALSQARAVLGDTTAEKHIYVDLTNQRLLAYEGNRLVYNFLVSTGKWNHTPTGDFRIWIWLRYTRMSGGDSPSTYYNLPNVPYTMYYYNNNTPKHWGYSLHGAYWHDNFGHPMSHGCVNMKIEEAGKIFYWSNPSTVGRGTTYTTGDYPGPIITVYGTTPRE